MTHTGTSQTRRNPGTPARATSTTPIADPESNGQNRQDHGDTAELGIAEILEELNFRDDEFVGIGHAAPGGTFKASVMPPDLAPRYVDTLGDTVNIWFSVNPTAGPARANSGRGTSDQTTRLADAYADLDIKDGACPDMPTGEAIIDAASAFIGQRPTVVVFSGHGLQPHWPIENGDITDTFTTAHAAALSRRFGRLVDMVAAQHNVKVDNVSDLARVMRVPGSTNVKADPAPVTARRDTGGPLTVEEIDDRLNEAGIYREHGDDRLSNAEVLSPPGDWVWADTTCPYMAKVIDNWRTDTPSNRHPWLTSNLGVKLHAAHRHGCLTQESYRDAQQVITARFKHLLAMQHPRREPGSFEITQALKWGIERVAALTDDEVLAELGNHTHTATVHHTAHLAMAYRLAAGWHNKLLYVHGIGWHYYTETHWAYDDIGAAYRAVYGMLKALWPQAFGDSDEQKQLAKAISRCETATGITGILTLAKALPEFAATVRSLDADPYLLNCPNGTYDLRTRQLRPHDPADRITKVTRGAYQPQTISTGTWHTVLAELLPDEAVRSYVQRQIGQSLVGRVIEHLLSIWTGTGANGKTTIVKALCHSLGDYASTAEPDLFMQRQSAHPTGEMDLLGRRLVVVSESQSERHLDEAKMKRLTGGDTIRARRMRQDFIEFEPSHTALLITNHLPKVSGDDPATWRRIRVIPFDVVIPPEKRNPHLDEQLQLDADAILAWGIAGWHDYIARGEKLDEPDAVLVATDEYRRDSDAVERFISEECVTTSPALKATTSQLYEAWKPWAEADGAREMSRKAFGQALDRHGYPFTDKARDGRWREGIGLKVKEDES